MIISSGMEGGGKPSIVNCCSISRPEVTETCSMDLAGTKGLRFPQEREA